MTGTQRRWMFADACVRCVDEARIRVLLDGSVAERVGYAANHARQRCARRDAVGATAALTTVAFLVEPGTATDVKVQALVAATHLATAALAHAADPTRGRWSALCAKNAKLVVDVLAPVPAAVTLAADGFSPEQAAEAAELLGGIGS